MISLRLLFIRLPLLSSSILFLPCKLCFKCTLQLGNRKVAVARLGQRSSSGRSSRIFIHETVQRVIATSQSLEESMKISQKCPQNWWRLNSFRWDSWEFYLFWPRTRIVKLFIWILIGSRSQVSWFLTLSRAGDEPRCGCRVAIHFRGSTYD